MDVFSLFITYKRCSKSWSIDKYLGVDLLSNEQSGLQLWVQQQL